MAGIDIVFLIDSSESMDEELSGDRKITWVCKTVSKAIKEALDPSKSIRVAVMFFHATKSGDVPKVDILIPLQNIENVRSNMSKYEKLMVSLKPAGGTPIGYGLEKAVILLGDKSTDKHVILLTDGENNVGPDPVEVAYQASSKGVKIHALGIGDEVNVIELGSLANVTGGTFRKIGDEEDLWRELKEILAVIGALKMERHVNTLEGQIREVLSSLRNVRKNVKELEESLSLEKMSAEEYSAKLSLLRSKEDELLTRLRDLRSRAVKRLIELQLSLLGSQGKEREDIVHEIESLRDVLRESEEI